MEYRIEITDEATHDIDEAYSWFQKDSPLTAIRWYDGLIEALYSLSHNPQRCAIAPEDRYFEQEIRQLLYGKRRNQYRILFTVLDDTVYILHVRHALRNWLKPE